jgi:hypothetical protein
VSFVEASLCRLQNSFRGFLVPSAALDDVGTLRDQLELRCRALKDIELIRCRLRPFMRCDKKQAPRRLRISRVSRSRLNDSYRAGFVRRAA